jgi:uncharacterized protein YukE
VARYSFPALGFDPAPGDPDAVDGVAQDCTRCAQELADDANRLGQVQHLETWQGQAAAAFASHPAQLRDDLLKASHAYGGASTALTAYAIALRQAQLQAHRTEDTVAEARLRIDRHGAEADRLTALIESAPPGMSTADQEFERDGFRRRQVSAQEECEAAITLARRIALALEHDGDQAAARLRSLGDAPYHQPGVLSRLVGGTADWVSTHADALRAVSNVLKGVSAVAGLLSFIPVLTPIFAPIAAITAVGALAIDAALVATGHGDWKSVAVDGVLIALPGAGRLGSRAMAVRGADALTPVRAALNTQLPERELFRGAQVPKATDVGQWAERQGWKRSQTPTGPIKYFDEQGILRVTIKRGSPRTPGSEQPHVELRDAAGKRIDRHGNPAVRRSPDNHTPIEWDLNE